MCTPRQPLSDECKKFCTDFTSKLIILVRSPRRNFIENALRAMRKNKQKNAVSRNIQETTFKQFYNRAMT